MAIVLVPEISLTPQMVNRFLARFGESIAVLHSKLSIGERFDEWQKIKNGEVKIVIGARSAIFAPVRNLGIIIIDEEHDMSYKSEMTPRYNAKEIANNAKTAYGATVTNYDVDGNTGVNWKIFYSDGINVYLIADDYINYDKVPLSTGNVNKPNQSDSFSKAVYFTNILGDYEGSSNISSNNLALKWLSKYHEKKYTSKYNNMKAVAYMMDTNIWNNFKEDTALNVIGGPTLEMLFASYNAKYGTKYECQATSERGYSIRKTASDDWSERITGILDSNDSLYTISSQSDALSYWVASPSNYYETYSEGNHLLSVYYSGSVTYSFYNAKDIGFRPVICLNPNAKLVKQADGTYQIQ